MAYLRKYDADVVTRHSTSETVDKSDCFDIDLRSLATIVKRAKSKSHKLPLGVRSPPTACDMIIGNQPLPSWTLSLLVETNGFIVCADGGANRLYDRIQLDVCTGGSDTASFEWPANVRLPNAIIGDLDSLRQEVRTYFEDRKVAVVRVADQNYSDATKALSYLIEELNPNGPKNVIFMFGFLGGRLDHQFGNMSVMLHHIHTVRVGMTAKSSGFCIAVGEDSVTMILPGGRLTSRVRMDPELWTRSVGLIPLIPCRSVTSLGLEWDLTEAQMSLDGFISTCNRIVSDDSSVYVTSSDPICWTSSTR